MNIYEKLQEAGLTGNEAKVYLELAKKGQLSANQLARNLGIDRTSAYTILNHLIEKAHVSYVVKEGKKIFSCSRPENLLNSVKLKETLILELVKEITKIKKEKQEIMEVEVYEGKEGIRAFFKKLIEGKNLCAFGSTGRAYDLLFESSAIAKEAEKKKIKMRIIANKECKQRDFIKYKNLDVRFVDYTSEATTTIFEDYVSIHLIKGKPIIIIIKNRDIAETYKKHFEFMWEKAGK